MQATARTFHTPMPALVALRAAAGSLLLASSAAWAQVPQSTPPAAATPMSRPSAASAPLPTMGTTPDNRATPLVTVPLGRTSADPANGAASAGTTDDGMARCKAMPAGPARNDCLRKARITAPAR